MISDTKPESKSNRAAYKAAAGWDAVEVFANLFMMRRMEVSVANPQITNPTLIVAEQEINVVR